ncbi:type II toxin-antitoxin system antitoxin DNA ADP-ribosyl glycohydrolase DarG [Gandjariella thermophila]|uniref:Macro domain-containing protein n=1 Tax=Gandjariella thermophila TaxID=1931992 RepID=A0A4D4JCE9_9PSEU|nr:macro domain-containing protein [Gandjariella thermophila]GDY33042.1 hypothetical protein GTS_46750 [Gandjariella thermophila]
MIVNGEGDLLTADVDALVNTVNCVGVMGKGIALQFKRRYPENFRLYEAACERGEVQLGRMFVTDLHSISGPRYIVNFPTKGHWRARSRIADIRAGLDDLVRVILDREIRSIAVPPLGTGNGGLPWREVEPLIREALGNLPDTTVHLYTPSNAARHLAPQPIKMTWGRATLVELVREYVNRRLSIEPWEELNGASHLEIQKLMYFAHLVMPSLRLDFARGRYGPYSEEVRHLVKDMEGVFLEGYGDGTSPVQKLDPIAPTPDGLVELERYLHGSKDGGKVRTEIVAPVMNIINGFESPYAIELLASTHWVAWRESCRSPYDAWAAIQTWTPRKSRLFTEHHVSSAWRKLRDVGLLPLEEHQTPGERP